jgi:L-rhamnose isomerase
VIETPSWGYGDSGNALCHLSAAGTTARRVRAARRRRRGPTSHQDRRRGWRYTSLGIAVRHLIDCIGIARELGSTSQSLWFADGTNYAGQDDLGARRHRFCWTRSTRVYAELPAERALLVEYKLFEPAFYATISPTGARRCSSVRSWGSGRTCFVYLGHHAQGVKRGADRGLSGRRGTPWRL